MLLMVAEQPEIQASDSLGRFGPGVVEGHMAPAGDTRKVVVVVVGNNPVAVEVVDHHTVDSDNPAEELDLCKAD